MTFDIAKIKAAGYSPVAAVLLTNSDDYPEFKVVKNRKDPETGRSLYRIKLNNK